MEDLAESWSCLQLLKGGCSEVGADLFSPLTSGRTTGNGLKLHRGGLDWVLGKLFVEKVVKPWKRLPKEVVESPSLELFKMCRCGT